MAEVKAIERQTRMADLEARLTLARSKRSNAERGNAEASSSANSTQTLLGDDEASRAQIGEARAETLNTGMKNDFLPLVKQFSAINVEHFKNIAENKFQPENMYRLHNDYAQMKSDKKYIRMGEIDLLTRDDDASATDTKGMVQLADPGQFYQPGGANALTASHVVLPQSPNEALFFAHMGIGKEFPFHLP